MATVRNTRRHVVDLTGGQSLAPGEERNIDTTGAHEQQLLADGSLIIVDNTAAPPAPATHWPAGGRAYDAAYAGHDWDAYVPAQNEALSELDDQVVALTAQPAISAGRTYIDATQATPAIDHTNSSDAQPALSSLIDNSESGGVIVLGVGTIRLASKYDANHIVSYNPGGGSLTLNSPDNTSEEAAA